MKIVISRALLSLAGGPSANSSDPESYSTYEEYIHTMTTG